MGGLMILSGLLVSTLSRTQLEAVQFAFVIMLPSVLLSGFMFPRSEMPLPIYLLTFGIPVTYFIEILRGIILATVPSDQVFLVQVGLFGVVVYFSYQSRSIVTTRGRRANSAL